jgi:arabinofuranan 3-O-arabinosyltransferase
MAFGVTGSPAPRHPRLSLNLERVVVLALWVLLAAVIFLNKHGIFTPDIKPEIYLAPARSARDLAFSWLENQQLGLPNFNVGLAPVPAFVALLHGVGISAAACVRLLRLALLITAGWGASRLYRHLAPGNGTAVGRVLAGVVYLANPYVVVAGDTLAIVLPLALLPWQVLFLVKALEERRSWRWPAAFALTFVLMSGMNAGVVPALQLVYVPAVVLYAASARNVRLRDLAKPLARCALLTVLVSLYWLIPAIAASGAGVQVVGNSETYRGIAGPSSFGEVIRGLGLWVMYGGGPDGPWQPGFVSYLTNPLVIALSYSTAILFVASTWFARGAVRRLALALVCSAAVVMVGLHPPGRPSPIGVAFRAAFTHVPATGALRTTNKAGAVLILGIALLVAVGASAWFRQAAGHGQPRIIGAIVAIALVGGSWPAFSGGLFSDSLTIPSYWKQAAAAVNSGPAQQRVWLVPGEVRSHYRWSGERVDDIDKSLISRPAVVQYTIPVASADSANFLTAIDTLMQEGSLPPGAVSTAARYLGASDVLVRNDLVWEESNGARPELMQPQIGLDSGLRLAGTFGQPGQNTVSPVYPPETPLAGLISPVQRYTVDAARGMLRIEPVAGSVLVDGDGWAIPPLVAAGLLDGAPNFRYVGELTPSQLDQALAAGTRLVITDTNRRRTSQADRLADSQGPLLPADVSAGPSRTLFNDPLAQTVLQVEGGQVSASATGSAFGQLPWDSPENAFDGDERTAWMFGDFGHGAGQSITLRMDAPQTLHDVRVVMRPNGPVVISKISITAGAVTRIADVPASGVAEVSFPSTTTDRLELKVLKTTGTGINLVGVNEIEVPGVRLLRVARMPLDLSALTSRLTDTGRRELSTTPIDVVLWRVRGGPLPADDEELGLNRSFSLPQARTYRLYGLIRPDPETSDEGIDQLLGFTGDVTASSSSRWSFDPAVRASAAVDGDEKTGWSPATPAEGQSITLSGKPRRIDHLDVLQPTTSTSFISQAAVLLDGREVTVASLHPGVTRVVVPPQTAARLTLRITAVSGPGPVQIAELSFGKARIVRHPAAAFAQCTPVAQLDGQPVLMRPVRPLVDLGPTVFTACGGPLSLAAGAHELRALHNWSPDELVLRDQVGDHPPVAPPSATDVVTTRLDPTHWRVTATLPAGPQVVVLGQNFDRRWRATIDGRPAGRTVTADGYSAAWIVNAPGRHTIDIRFTPQRLSTIGLVVSGSAVMLSLFLAGPWNPSRDATATASEQVRRRRRSARRRGRLPVRGWIVVVVVAWLAGGPAIAAVALAVMGWHAARPPRPRSLLALSTVLLALCPVVFMAGNLSRWGDVTPDLVLRNDWPHWLAATALLLLCVGVWREDTVTERTPGTAATPLADSDS